MFHEGPIVRAVEALYAAVVSGDEASLEAIVSDQFVDHSPGLGGGRDEFLSMTQMLTKAFSDFVIALEDVFVSSADNKVLVRSTLSGTHVGTLGGIEPTGKAVRVMSLDVFRIEDGRVLERWGLTDSVGLLQQLGVFPS